MYIVYVALHSPAPRNPVTYLKVTFEALLLQHTHGCGVKDLRHPDEPFQLRVARPAFEKNVARHAARETQVFA